METTVKMVQFLVSCIKLQFELFSGTLSATIIISTTNSRLTSKLMDTNFLSLLNYIESFLPCRYRRVFIESLSMAEYAPVELTVTLALVSQDSVETTAKQVRF